MPVYRDLNDVDFLQTVLLASPRVDAVSGTAGWRGGFDGSGSASVYAGVRGVGGSAVTVVPRIGPTPYDLGQFQPFSGSYPSSASLRYVEARLTDMEETSFAWGNRSWEPVERLYDWYSRGSTNYSTASYDYHSLFFRRGSANVVAFEDAELSQWQAVTSSLTLEAWVKPITTASAGGPGMTILSRTSFYRLFVTGADGVLAFTSSLGLVTSSQGISPGVWSHVAVSMGAGTLKMYSNLREVGSLSYAGAGITISTASFSPTLAFGNTFLGPRSLSGTLVYEDVSSPSSVGASGSSDSSFFGFLHEPREWSTARSYSQISSSYKSRIEGGSTGLRFYLRLTEGPLSGTSVSLMGSSSVNWATATAGADARLFFFGSRPSWSPNDNPYFYPDKTETRTFSRPAHLRILNVPSLFYGRQIATGSVELTCRSFSDSDHGLTRVLIDDGRGGLYVKSFLSSSDDDSTVQNVPWNRAGTVFYSEGVVLITHPALQDFGTPNNFSDDPSSLFSVSFRGVSRIPTRVVSCRVGPAAGNASNNQTYSVQDDTGRRRIVGDRTTYVTAVGLYDSNRNLVAVAKLAQPLRKRERDRINIRLKKDF